MLGRRNSFNVINKGESFPPSKEIVGASDGVAPLKRVVSAQESENLSLISTLAGLPGDDSTVQENISRARDEQKKKRYIYICARQRTFSYDRSGITGLMNSWYGSESVDKFTRISWK